MPRGDIPPDVLEFIVRRIDSVPHMEALLLMWKDSATSWASEEISRRVYVSRDQASAILRDLLQHGLIVQSPEAEERYRYDPGWDEGGLMPKVAAAYSRHLVHIAGMIHAKAASGAVQEFARAFKLKQQE